MYCNLKISLLYVDDEDILREVTKKYLEHTEEFFVDTSSSAIEALCKIEEREYDAIVSDYQMPEMDGLEFLRTLRANGNSTPFMIFTGRGREEVAIEALNAGADYYLQKGGKPQVQFGELQNFVRQAVQKARAEKKILDNEQRMKDIINFLPDATFAIDLEGKVIAWNRAIEEMTGTPASEMLGRGDYNYALPFYGNRQPVLVDIALHNELSKEVFYHVMSYKSGNKCYAETFIPHFRGGKGAYMWAIASLLYGADGVITGAIESIRDITDNRQRKQLRHSVFNHAGEAIIVCDSEGIVRRANFAAQQLAGENPLDKPLIEVFPIVPQESMTTTSMFTEFFGGTTFLGIEVHLGREKNTEYDLLFSGTPIFSESNDILNLVIVLSNITEQKKSKEQILHLNQVLQTIRQINQLLITEKDPDRLLQRCGDILIQNRGFDNVWIMQYDENRTFRKLYSSGNTSHFDALGDLLQKGQNIWCIKEALEQYEAFSTRNVAENCGECPLFNDCIGHINMNGSLWYAGRIFGTLSVVLPKHIEVEEEELNLFQEICHNIAFGLSTIELAIHEQETLIQIQKNMMQLAALNDEIRNSLTIIKAVISMENTEESRDTIDEQVEIINNTIKKLDQGWLNSEKIWNYLRKHHGFQINCV